MSSPSDSGDRRPPSHEDGRSPTDAQENGHAAPPGRADGFGAPPGPNAEPDWSGPEFDWEAERQRWRVRREMWRRQRMAQRGGRDGDRPFRRHGPPFGCIGCAIVAFIIIIGSTGAFVTWVLGSFFGFVAPQAGTPAGAGVAIALILVIAFAFAGRAFTAYVYPLAALAAATRRLADGEPDVRVQVRGPRPVRDLAASFNAMAERLDRSRASRQALLADVTHELRTPLTVIGGGLEAMLDGVHPMDPAHVAPLLAETQVMDRLLEDLRTLSLAEAGALALHREPADLVEVAGDAVSAQQPIARAKGVGLTLGGDAVLEASVDPVRVREIVTNLLTNAIRHTPPDGRVEVTVAAARGEAIIDVRDTGEGIPAADLPHVFDRFQRRADSGGSGLGLTIVRDLAVAHGGTVEATSEGAGLGARFRVRLPIRD